MGVLGIWVLISHSCISHRHRGISIWFLGNMGIKHFGIRPLGINEVFGH